LNADFLFGIVRCENPGGFFVGGGRPFSGGGQLLEFVDFLHADNCRHFGNLLQPRNGPRLLWRMTSSPVLHL
jgi:hypothetical protein